MKTKTLKYLFPLYKTSKMTTFTRGERNGNPRHYRKTLDTSMQYVKGGLLTLLMLGLFAGCKTVQGTRFINDMGNIAAGTLVQESIRKEMGHSDYRQSSVNSQGKNYGGQQVNIIRIPEYEIGDRYIPPGEGTKTIWTRVGEDRWTNNVNPQHELDDAEITDALIYTGAPIIRNNEKFINEFSFVYS